MRRDPCPVMVNGVKPLIVRCIHCKLPVVNTIYGKHEHKVRCFVNGRQVFYPKVTKASTIQGPLLAFEAFREESTGA